MPIKRDQFNKGNFKKRNYDIKTHPVALFLKKNSNCAWKNDEIAKRVKLNKDTVRGALKRLKKVRLIIHKAPYFAWKK